MRQPDFQHDADSGKDLQAAFFRRPPQDGQKPRPGQEKGVVAPSLFAATRGQQQPSAGAPQPRKARKSRTTKSGMGGAQAAAGEEGRQGTEGLFRRGAARSRSRLCGPFYAARLLPQSPHGAAEDVVHLSGLPPGTGYPPIPDAHIKKRSEGRILPPTSDL